MPAVSDAIRKDVKVFSILIPLLLTWSPAHSQELQVAPTWVYSMPENLVHGFHSNFISHQILILDLCLCNCHIYLKKQKQKHLTSQDKNHYTSVWIHTVEWVKCQKWLWKCSAKNKYEIKKKPLLWRTPTLNPALVSSEMLTFYYTPHKAVQWWPHSASCSHLLTQSLLLCGSPNIQPTWTTALARGWREINPHNVPTGVALKSHRTNAEIREATFVQTVQLRRQSKAFLSGNYVYSWNPWKYHILRKFWRQRSHLHLDICKSLLRQNSYT